MVSLGELFVILFVALLLLGPEQFPRLVKAAVKLTRYVKGITGALSKEIDVISQHIELDERESEAKKADQYYQDEHNAK